LIGEPLLHTHAAIGASNAPLTVVLQSGGRRAGIIRITAGSVLFAVRTSSGFESSAVFVRNVLDDVTLTGTVIDGNDAPIANASVRVQVNATDPFAPLHIHHAPVGVAVSVIPAGNGSLTVVVELFNIPEPTFFSSIA
jgi:hypothetical protein